MSKPPTLPESRVFTHQAMNTTFTFRLTGDAPHYPGIIRECVLLVDDLENHLSRFIETSEISRINRLRAGETLYLTAATHRCLLLAARANLETGGLFDSTLGRGIARRKSGVTLPVSRETGRLILHPDQPAITCESPGRQVDLGGIGKGYALDRLRELLLEHEVSGGLLEAGASTLCAFGPQAWPTQLTGDAEKLVIPLHNTTLSASGTELQGSHIVHPGGGDAPYLSQHVWAVSPSSALADAWSTALMLMTREQAAICLADENGSLSAAYAELDGKITSLAACPAKPGPPEQNPPA